METHARCSNHEAPQYPRDAALPDISGQRGKPPNNRKSGSVYPSPVMPRHIFSHHNHIN